jgi:hypothetical protein
MEKSEILQEAARRQNEMESGLIRDLSYEDLLAAVGLTRVPGEPLVTEADPWDAFEAECPKLPETVFSALECRQRSATQQRDFTAGIL